MCDYKHRVRKVGTEPRKSWKACSETGTNN